jgi:hypothetical protein
MPWVQITNLGKVFLGFFKTFFLDTDVNLISAMFKLLEEWKAMGVDMPYNILKVLMFNFSRNT